MNDAIKILEAVGVRKSYGDLEVLKGVDLTIHRGEIISIVGASGAGKTTLLQILGTLDKQSAGEVKINGVEVASLSERKLAKFRNASIGFVFQFHHLLPEFTAMENVAIPAFIANMGKQESLNKAAELLKMLNLGHRMDNKPGQLSGGEQQRVAVARALINDPVLVLADEPSGNLDSKSAEDLHSLFFDLREKGGQTFVIVTHNDALADLADRKVTMKDGVIA